MMNKKEQIIRLRNKIFGILILDSRIAARRSVEECAQAMGISPQQFESYENGQNAPSLPELEALCYYLHISPEHFLSKQSLSENIKNKSVQDINKFRQLQDQTIGSLLLQERNKANLTIEQVAKDISLTVEQLERYESGEDSIPIPELELITELLNINLTELLDQQGTIGIWRKQQETVKKYLELPIELQQFIAKPVNRPYLELATRISELSVEVIRTIAEELLEITY